MYVTKTSMLELWVRQVEHMEKARALSFGPLITSVTSFICESSSHQALPNYCTTYWKIILVLEVVPFTGIWQMAHLKLTFRHEKHCTPELKTYGHDGHVVFSSVQTGRQAGRKNRGKHSMLKLYSQSIIA